MRACVCVCMCVRAPICDDGVCACMRVNWTKTMFPNNVLHNIIWLLCYLIPRKFHLVEALYLDIT